MGIILVELYVKFKNMNNAYNVFHNMPSCFFGMFLPCDISKMGKGKRH